MGPYAHYLMEQSHIRNIPMKDLMTSLKDEWAKLSEIEKAKYKNQFLKDKEEYELAMAQWEAKMLKEGKNDLVRVKSMDEPKTSRVSSRRSNIDSFLLIYTYRSHYFRLSSSKKTVPNRDASVFTQIHPPVRVKARCFTLKQKTLR